MKLAIWDFDGTLAFRTGLWASAMVQVLDAVRPDHGITEEHLRPHLRTGFPWHQPDVAHNDGASGDVWWSRRHELFERVYLSAGVEPAAASTCARKVRDSFCEISGWSLFPDTVLTLERLAYAGWTHAVLSNHVPELPDIAAGLAIDHLFAEIFTTALIGFEKPHPEAFLTVLRRFPERSQVWMIGDNPVADIAGSRAVGIPSILVRQRHCCIVPCCDDLDGVVELLTGPLSES